MDKEKIIREESDNLGSVIKHLVDFDARQREIISSEIASRESQRRELEAQRSDINEKYMKQAEERLSKLEKSENERAEKAVRAAETAASKNIAELEKTAAKNSTYWIEEIYKRTIRGE